MVKMSNKRRLEKIRASKPSDAQHVVFLMGFADEAELRNLARLKAAGVPESDILIVRWLDEAPKVLVFEDNYGGGSF
jgi:hypothetical protein